MTGAVFFGALAWPPLLEAVLGCDVSAFETADLPGRTACISKRDPFPSVVKDKGHLPGLFTLDLSRSAQERLTFFAEVFELSPHVVDTKTYETTHQAVTYAAPHNGAQISWSQDTWQSRWGQTLLSAAQDVIECIHDIPATTLRTRRQMILSRAAARAAA